MNPHTQQLDIGVFGDWSRLALKNQRILFASRTV